MEVLKEQQNKTWSRTLWLQTELWEALGGKAWSQKNPFLSPLGQRSENSQSSQESIAPSCSYTVVSAETQRQTEKQRHSEKQTDGHTHTERGGMIICVSDWLQTLIFLPQPHCVGIIRICHHTWIPVCPILNY